MGSASFSEPWLFGKKPTSLNTSLYYTRQTNSYLALNILNDSQYMEVYGFAAGIGKRLKWPDNYFVLYNQLSWQTYKLLGIGGDECTPDRRFSLTASRCIGACGLAPVLTVNEDVYGRLTADDVEDIIKKYI